MSAQGEREEGEVADGRPDVDDQRMVLVIKLLLLLLLLLLVSIQVRTNAHVPSAAVRVDHGEDPVKPSAKTFQVVLSIFGWCLCDHLNNFIIGVIIRPEERRSEPEGQKVHL